MIEGMQKIQLWDLSESTLYDQIQENPMLKKRYENLIQYGHRIVKTGVVDKPDDVNIPSQVWSLTRNLEAVLFDSSDEQMDYLWDRIEKDIAALDHTITA